ncbi:MAG: ABC transporter permease [Mycobacteriales bacterium]
MTSVAGVSRARPRISLDRRQGIGVVGVVLGVLTLGLFGLAEPAGRRAHLALTATDAGRGVTVPTLVVPVHLTCTVLGIVMILVGLAQTRVAGRGRGGRLGNWSTAFTLVAVVFAFLAWSDSGRSLPLNLVDAGNGAMVRAVPIILGALAGIVCERSGVINIAIEGQFLVGAFAGGMVASALTHGNATATALWLGIAAAGLAGLLLGLLLAVFSIRYLVNQVILGVVLNVFALGLTSFLYDRVLSPHANQLNQGVGFPDVKVPGLYDIPILGPILFDSNVFLYLTYGLLIVLHIGLFRTRWGLRLRAVGEHPTAADTVGIKVRATRYKAVMLGGLIAGIGGATFTIGAGVEFGKNLTSGRGYIALAAVIFGAWKPRGALFAALVFGFADVLASALGVIGSRVPSDFLSMAPYVVTIFAVAGLIGRVQAHKADGEPYETA